MHIDYLQDEVILFKKKQTFSKIKYYILMKDT